MSNKWSYCKSHFINAPCAELPCEQWKLNTHRVQDLRKLVSGKDRM